MSANPQPAKQLVLRVPTQIKLVSHENGNHEILCSVMFTWENNKDEITPRELYEDINEIIWKAVADYGFGDEDVDMNAYARLVDYLANLYQEH